MTNRYGRGNRRRVCSIKVLFQHRKQKNCDGLFPVGGMGAVARNNATDNGRSDVERNGSRDPVNPVTTVVAAKVLISSVLSILRLRHRCCALVNWGRSPSWRLVHNHATPRIGDIIALAWLIVALADFGARRCQREKRQDQRSCDRDGAIENHVHHRSERDGTVEGARNPFLLVTLLHVPA